jgi:hypothetical protein
LHSWYEQLSTLYGPQCCLINEHMTGCHLTNSVKNYGPLCVHNAFSFESFYGYILSLKSGTHTYQNHILQINGWHMMSKHLLYSSKITNENRIGKLLEKIGVDVQQIVNK